MMKRFYCTPIFNKGVVVSVLEKQKVNYNKTDNKKIFKLKKYISYENMYSCLPFKRNN